MTKIYLTNVDELKYGRREAINSLKTNVKFAGNDIKIISFTSCNPNEGKSTVCFDLAKAFADAGEKVLLIDADMRKTVLVQRYRIDNRGADVKGLTHYLSGQAHIDEILCGTNIQNLFMVMSGPLSPNPAELLSGPAFGKLLDTCRKLFDTVIIDTPPLGAVIDAAIIAPKCDGTVLVTESNVTSARVAIGVKKQLEMSDCKILGCVINKVPSSGNAYKYKYRYYGEYKADDGTSTKRTRSKGKH